MGKRQMLKGEIGEGGKIKKRMGWWRIGLLEDKIREADCRKKRQNWQIKINYVEPRQTEEKKPEGVLISNNHGK